MKGGKDEKLQLGPLFPRLHVNSDIEKGGTRGPPRNKMAHCERLDTPSQRLSSGSMSMRPLSSSNSTSLFPLASVSHGHCQKMDGFSLFCSSLEHSHMAGRCHSNYLGPKYRECRTLESGNYKARQPLRMTTEYKWQHPFGFYNSVNISAKEDDFRNPCFGVRRKIMNARIVKQAVKKEGANPLSSRSLGKHQTAFKKQDRIEKIYVTSREYPRDHAEDSSKVSGMSDEKAEMLCLLPSAGEKVSADAALGVWAIYRTHESGNRSFVHLNHQKRSFANSLSKLSDNCEQMHQECRNLPSETACVEIVSGDPVRPSRKRSSSAMEKPSCSGRLAGENNRMQHRIESINKSPKENDCESSRVEEYKRSSAISDVSVVDSTSPLVISPDDVLRLMGPEVFWQVRRTIAHQQRVFTAQIFELHRLIKVQKLIAKLPEMLPDGDLILSKPVNSLTENKLQMESFPEPPAVFLDPAKRKTFPDYAAEEAQNKLPPKGDTKKGDSNPNSSLKPYSEAPAATSCAPDEAKFGPLCVRVPSGYQWLVPVRSPSEGLIYKPCTGPYPPTAGSIAPSYCGYGTMSSSRKDAAYVNIAFGVPASNQGIVISSGPDTLDNSCCQTNSPAPDINSQNKNSAVLQLSTTHSTGQDNRLSSDDINYIIPYQSSYNVSQRSGLMTDSGRNLLVSKCSDLQGSSASSPGKRVQGDELPLFPITPTDDQNSQRKIEVIKVVPHNPKSASESAARIFQSIQEERKQD